MITGTALIVVTWVVFCGMLSLPVWAGVLITVVAALWILFCMLFGMYFFNIDMKLLAVLQDILLKNHDKKAKKRKI